MDKTDKNIIRCLQQNARITNQELAEKVNLSPSPCLRRVKALEQSGIIKNYTLEVDAEAYGLPITVFVLVQLDKHSQEVVKHFEQSIAAEEKVLECFVMTGRADYLLKVVVKDLHDYEHFVRHRLHSIGLLFGLYGDIGHALLLKGDYSKALENYSKCKGNLFLIADLKAFKKHGVNHPNIDKAKVLLNQIEGLN